MESKNTAVVYTVCECEQCNVCHKPNTMTFDL